MNESETGQVSGNAAEVYEEFFVPALFLPWAVRMVDTADIQSGQDVLDVACGTGIVARTASARTGPSGSVAGVDCNDGMLAVAARKAPSLDWRNGQAEVLPYAGDQFDTVLCQFGLMFFDDPVAAVREMARVTRPGGRIVVAVWSDIERTPGYERLADLVQREAGKEAADALRAPFRMGDQQRLATIFAQAGLSQVQLVEHEETVRFPSVEAWMFTEIKGWVLADSLSDSGYARLLEKAGSELAMFVTATGTVEFPVRAWIARSEKSTSP